MKWTENILLKERCFICHTAFHIFSYKFSSNTAEGTESGQSSYMNFFHYFPAREPLKVMQMDFDRLQTSSVSLSLKALSICLNWVVGQASSQLERVMSSEVGELLLTKVMNPRWPEGGQFDSKQLSVQQK